MLADVSGLSTDTIFRGAKNFWRLKKGQIYCHEKSVTNRQEFDACHPGRESAF